MGTDLGLAMLPLAVELGSGAVSAHGRVSSLGLNCQWSLDSVFASGKLPVPTSESLMKLKLTAASASSAKASQAALGFGGSLAEAQLASDFDFKPVHDPSPLSRLRLHQELSLAATVSGAVVGKQQQLRGETRAKRARLGDSEEQLRGPPYGSDRADGDTETALGGRPGPRAQSLPRADAP